MEIIYIPISLHSVIPIEQMGNLYNRPCTWPQRTSHKTPTGQCDTDRFL